MRNVPSSVVSRIIGLGTRQSVHPATQISFDQAGGGDSESSVGLAGTSASPSVLFVADGHPGASVTGQIADKEGIVSLERIER